jgi:hypothetical protein
VDDTLLASTAAAPKVDGAFASLYAAAQPSASVVEALGQLRAQWAGMSGAERWTLRGACGLLVSLGLPWRWTLETEDLIGFVAGGWPVALLALVAGLAVLSRNDPRLEALRGRVGALVAGVSSLAVLACAVFLRTAYRADLLRSGGRLQLHVLERPMFGAWLGLAAAVVMLLGALASWRRRGG